MSLLLKRSVLLAGHKTSISLEAEFWVALKEIAQERDIPIARLIEIIDSERNIRNLSSAVRLYVLAFYRAKCGLT